MTNVTSSDKTAKLYTETLDNTAHIGYNKTIRTGKHHPKPPPGAEREKGKK